MRRVAIALAGVVAVAGCGGPDLIVPGGVPADRTVAQAETKKPSLADLKGMIPESLDPNEATQVVSPQADEDVAAPQDEDVVEGSDEPQAESGEARTVMQRGRGRGFGGFRGGGFRDGGFRFRGGGFGRHHIFFPRHRSFFRHRFFHAGRLWRPFWRSNALFYPVVYSGIPYYVQYCWSPAAVTWVPCDVVATVI